MTFRLTANTPKSERASMIVFAQGLLTGVQSNLMSIISELPWDRNATLLRFSEACAEEIIRNDYYALFETSTASWEIDAAGLDQVLTAHLRWLFTQYRDTCKDILDEVSRLKHDAKNNIVHAEPTTADELWVYRVPYIQAMISRENSLATIDAINFILDRNLTDYSYYSLRGELREENIADIECALAEFDAQLEVIEHHQLHTTLSRELMTAINLSEELYEEIKELVISQEVIAGEFEPSYITAQSKLPHLVEHCAHLLNITANRRKILSLPNYLCGPVEHEIAEQAIAELSDLPTCDMIRCTISFYNGDTATSSQTTTLKEKKLLRWLADRLPELKATIAEALLLAEKVLASEFPDQLGESMTDADEYWAGMYPYFKQSVAEICVQFYSLAFTAETNGQSVLQYEFLSEYDDDYVYTGIEEALHHGAEGIEKPEHLRQYKALLAELTQLTEITYMQVEKIKDRCSPHRIQVFKEFEIAHFFANEPDLGLEA